MNVQGKPTRTISAGRDSVVIIDQTALPHAFVTRELSSDTEVAQAIASMLVRGAPLIGAAARTASGWRCARTRRRRARVRARGAPGDAAHRRQPAMGARPWRRGSPRSPPPHAPRPRAPPPTRSATRTSPSTARSARTALPLLARRARRAEAGEPINVLTHCNAGWLATVDWGTALAPSMPRTTRAAGPRLGRRDAAAQPGRHAHGVGAGRARRPAHGDRRQRGRPPDAARGGRLVLVGTDRTTAHGDVVNKIGTY